ncbi:MAG: hypothetical protein WC365_09460 [Candidatus Babeliales bacterium]|jgi:hypothetical protein
MTGFSEGLAKTINNHRGYRLGNYETEYDAETEQFRLYHYGTLTCTFSLTKPLPNGEYCSIYGGYSISDRDTVSQCIRHVNDQLGTEYDLQKQLDHDVSANKLKTFNEEYTIFSTDRNYCLTKPKLKKQATFHAFEPFLTQMTELKQEIEIAKHQIQQYVNQQLEYLKTFESTNINIQENGIAIQSDNMNLLVSYEGDVYDLATNQRVCVQVSPYDGAHTDLTDTDKCITKALGLIKNPQALNKGIRYKSYRKPTKTLAETIFENQSHLKPIKQQIETLSETRIHESWIKRQHVTFRNTNKTLIGKPEKTKTKQLLFNLNDGILTFKIQMQEPKKLNYGRWYNNDDD